jgi:CRP-like cAMP-binding protein
MTITGHDRVAFLKQTQLFRGLNEARLNTIADNLVERTCASGEIAVSQGKVADRIFLIYSGRVRLPLDPDPTAEQPPELVTGNYFGEEALTPRSFYANTMTAQEETLLLELSSEYFNLLPAVFITDRVAFLKRIHLFQGLNDEQFNLVAEDLDEQRFKEGDEIIKEGVEGGSVYLIYSGKVRVTRKGREKPLATFVAGDYMGEESVLVKHHRRTATVTAVEDTLTLVLTREDFNKLLKQAPSLRANFAVTVNSHRLERRIHFSWLQPDEVIYFLARKHPILLLQTALLPALIALAGTLGMILTWWYSLNYPVLAILWWIALVATIAGVGWSLWNIMDWGNDYYIVTDRRVVWLEKVIGIYDSRQETPLSGIQRVNVQTALTGRVLDYGDVIVRTIVGSTLNLRHVDHPYQAAALMEEHWRRSKDSSRKMEEDEMRQALRTRLLEGQRRPVQAPTGIVAKDSGQKKNFYQGQRNIANLFRMRFEQLSTVTYRKHVFVLFAQTWKAGLILLVLLGIFFLEIFSPNFSFASLFGSITAEMLLGIWALLFLAGFAWWGYEYIDWSNDIFQVTPDQIMDIDKTPLGEVTSDIAALDNILSIEYERKGILELLFNYGTVFITVGGGKQMAFENVFNPSAVQDDIERRRLERITKKEQASIKNERERMADWFAAYYHNEENIRGEGEKIGDIFKGDGSEGGEIEEN